MANRWNEIRDAVEAYDEARTVAAQKHNAYFAAQAEHVEAEQQVQVAAARVAAVVGGGTAEELIASDLASQILGAA